MPNIVSFSTEIWYHDPESSGFINTPLQMTKLESLSIVEINPFSMSGFLTCLTLPSLKSIKLSANGPLDGDPDDDRVLATRSMIQRSACSIKSLEIDSAIWNGPSTLGDLLQVTPQLETFSIGWNTEYDLSKAMQFLVASIGTCSTSCLAPSLQHLKLLYRPSFEPQACLCRLGRVTVASDSRGIRHNYPVYQAYPYSLRRHLRFLTSGASRRVFC